MLKAKLLGATAGAEAALAIEDVFSTYLYTGNGSTQTITNGIDLAGEGGLVWTKPRSAATFGDHILVDSERGDFQIQTNTTAANNAIASFNFSSTGYVVPNNNRINQSGITYASWTFRQAPRFFDVVTYTGTGANRTIAHDLGVVPGCIIVKRTDTTGNWQVYHRSLANTQYMVLNSTAAAATGTTRWNSTTPTSSVFSIGTDATVNASGGTYVAYLFAHDPLGPSGDGSDGFIACGSYTGNGLAAGPTVTLGWEPQWLLVKDASSSGTDWLVIDNMRGFTVAGRVDAFLKPNLSDAEDTGSYFAPTATGFSVTDNSYLINSSGNTYAYIAIRRGPMREPTVGTEVFQPAIENSTDNPRFDAPFPVDMAFQLYPTGGSSSYPRNGSRLTGTDYLVTSGTVAADTTTNMAWGYMQGFYLGIAAGTGVAHMFRRAPGFFDVVAYTGTGVARTINHNLGVAPELMIVKKRSAVDNWIVYAGDATDYLILNTTAATADLDTMWNDTAPTSSVFSLGTNDDVNGNTATFIAYLFATLPGISKVGTYTGNGSNQTINCGFTTGARFILIKRTDSTGDWYVWDTARGIVAGNDPRLSLNSTAAEVTTDDTIDPANSGFIVNQVTATNVNVSSASYIFYAVS